MKDYLETAKKYLKGGRYEHSVNTAKEAAALARAYGADENKAYTAGILHDLAKDFTKKEALLQAAKYGIEVDGYCRENIELLHGLLSAEIAKKELDVQDEEILSAIACHTTGKRGMSLLDKIIYVADLIEPKRGFAGIEDIRNTAYNDMDKAVLTAVKSVLAYVMERGLVIHPDTIEAYNDITIKRRETLGKRDP